MLIKFVHHGNFDKTDKFLDRMSKREYLKILSKYGEQGVSALALATPSETGTTAASWNYSISIGSGEAKIEWSNSNINKGFPIAIMLQYGHGTGTGGYVQGRDYINPVMRPIFDAIAEEAWKEVVSA